MDNEQDDRDDQKQPTLDKMSDEELDEMISTDGNQDLAPWDH